MIFLKRVKILTESITKIARRDDIFCNTFIEDKCIAAFGENLFYTDDNHLSIEGTSLSAERILHVLEKE